MTYFPDTASGISIANLTNANALAGTDLGVVNQGGADGKATLATQAAFTLAQPFPNWTTGGRPATPSVGTLGFNTTLGRFDFYNGTAWNQHARIGGEQFQGATSVLPKALAYGATVTIDASQGNDFIVGATASGSGTGTTFTVTGLSGNITLANPTGLVEGQVVNIWLPQDATGGRTIIYGSLFLPMDGAAAYALSTAANAVDLLACKYIISKLRYTGRKVS